MIVEFAGDRSGNDHAFAILAHTGGMRIVARLGVRALWRFLFARRAAFANLIVQIFASAVETLEAAADSLARGHRRHRAIVTVAAARATMRRLARVFVRAERLCTAPVAVALATLTDCQPIAALESMAAVRRRRGRGAITHAARAADFFARLVVAVRARAFPDTSEKLTALAIGRQRAQRVVVMKRFRHAARSLFIRRIRRCDVFVVAFRADASERFAVNLFARSGIWHFDALRLADARATFVIAHAWHVEARAVACVVPIA